jgi:hypothetical protein
LNKNNNILRKRTFFSKKINERKHLSFDVLVKFLVKQVAMPHLSLLVGISLKRVG